MKDASPATGRIGPINSRIIGICMIAHLLIILVMKIHAGTQQDMLWLCHVMLGVAGVGFILRSSLLLTAALTAMLIPQLFWLVDCTIGVATGTFPLGLTNHVADFTAWQWLLTSYHMYLLPVLLIAVCRRGEYPAAALPLSIGIYAALTLICRSLPAEANVNSAHHAYPGLDVAFFTWANSLPAPAYLLALNVWMGFVIFLPAAIIVRYLTVRTPALTHSSIAVAVEPCSPISRTD